MNTTKPYNVKIGSSVEENTNAELTLNCPGYSSLAKAKKGSGCC